MLDSENERDISGRTLLQALSALDAHVWQIVYFMTFTLLAFGLSKLFALLSKGRGTRVHRISKKENGEAAN